MTERNIMDVTSGPTHIQHNGKATRGPGKRRGRSGVKNNPASVVDDVQALGRAAMRTARRTVASLRDGAAEYTDEGRDKVQQVERTIEEYIRDRPLKTVLIAAGVGLLLGRFWMRR